MSESSGSRARKRIAILGGGLGGLAAAFELTSQPRWYERYQLTVYQKGWRLGGKGASGRGENDRIEEHGLHCFWGFYDNAFGMLRSAYAEVAREAGPIRTINDAFKKLSAVWFIERVAGEWCRYEMNFPENDEEPGAGPALTRMSVSELVARYVEQLREALSEQLDVRARLERAFELDLDARLEALVRSWRERIEDLRDAVGDEARELFEKLAGIEAPEPEPEASASRDERYRRYILLQAAKLAGVLFVGLLRDGMPTSLEDFDAFDRWDLREWLHRHGADVELLRSPVVRGLYNASFCYPGGDFANPNLAAGVSLRALLLMGFTYKGSFMWKMQSSMGDVVFAPLYEALVRRGKEADEATGVEGSLRFEFFHKVTKLRPAGGGVASIVVEQQARPKDGPYRPLVDVKGLPSWPALPLYDQLVDGDALRGFDLESDWSTAPPVATRVLERGEDFDHVVLAIPVAALRAICSELVEIAPAWRRMVDGVETIRTKSFQVWLQATPEQAAWQREHHIMTDVYEDDFNSVADMAQTLPFESWPAGDEPGSVVYFSTAMADDPNQPTAPDDTYQAQQDAVVEKEARAWLAKWQEGIFGWLGPDPKPDAFRHFFFRANVNADQRYVLSVKDSTRFRLAPGGSGFDNLFLAGDWTRSPLNLGCAEGATMSGLEAGRCVVRALDAADARARRADFIEYPGMPVYPPAYHQKGITLCQFVLEADADRLDVLVDRLLGGDDGHRFTALGRWVVFQTGHIAENASDPPGDAYGTGSETSASFLVPVARWRRGEEEPTEIGLFAPFVFVDHPLSLVAGREVLGLPKALARFTPGGGPSDLDDLSVSTMVVKRLGPTSRVEEAPLVRVRRLEHEVTGSLGEAFEGIMSLAFDKLASTLPSRGGPLALASDALQGVLREITSERHMRFFSVRQLRDAAAPTRAAFREIVRSRMRLGDVSLEWLPKRHTIEIEPCESHPIAALLGLAEGPLDPTFEIIVRVDEATLEVEPWGQTPPSRAPA